MFWITDSTNLRSSILRPRALALIAACGMMLSCSNQASESSAKDSKAQKAALQSTPKASNIEWYGDAAELPAQHPCHDSAPVLKKVLTRGSGGEISGVASEYTTIAELLKSQGDVEYLGGRTVQGVRWSDMNGDFEVVACNLRGGGIKAYRAPTDEGADRTKVPAQRPAFVLDLVGEANNVERGGLWRRYRTADEKIKAPREKVYWRNNDEGNEPHYVARAGLVAAEDTDSNGRVEMLGYTVYDFDASEHPEADDICPANIHRSRCRAFALTIIVFEGDEEVEQRLVLRVDGSQASVGDITSAGEMDEAQFATLSAVIEAYRPAIIEQVVAMLRDAKKLADTP